MIFELHQSTTAKKHTSKILPPTYTQNDRAEVLAAAVAVIGVHRRSVASIQKFLGWYGQRSTVSVCNFSKIYASKYEQLFHHLSNDVQQK